MTHQVFIRRVTEGASFSPYTGIEGRAVAGDSAMAILVRFDPDVLVPHHRHTQEQLGVVIAGAMILGYEDDERELVTGDAYVIPKGVDHWARSGVDGCTCVEVFSPPRQDYLDFIASTAGPTE